MPDQLLVADQVARILARPDPLLAWLAGHAPRAIVGLNISVENGLLANFLREQLALPKRTIKVYQNKTEIVGPQILIVIHPAWLSILLNSFAMLLPPLTALPAGDMHRAASAVHRYWTNRVKRHYWGGLRNPDGFYE